MDMDGMMNYFHFTDQVTVLFQFWKTTNVWGFLITLFSVIGLTVLYEWITNRRALVIAECRHLQLTYRLRFKLTFYHVVSLTLHYGLMLVVMTFNAGLALAVIFGAGVGYFLFIPNRKNSSTKVKVTTNISNIAFPDAKTGLINKEEKEDEEAPPSCH